MDRLPIFYSFCPENTFLTALLFKHTTLRLTIVMDNYIEENCQVSCYIPLYMQSTRVSTYTTLQQIGLDFIPSTLEKVWSYNISDFDPGWVV